MGEVYAAWDERLERRVAVKLIRPESADSPAVRERFRREARAAAALNHPAVVQVYDVLAAEHGDAIVMEYVEGRTLAELLRTSVPSRDVALALAAQIADGLAAAHARGIVHRDLKTENEHVAPGQRPVLRSCLQAAEGPRRAHTDRAPLSLRRPVAGGVPQRSSHAAGDPGVGHRVTAVRV